MVLVFQIGAAFLLVTLTLWLHCGGLVTLIAWVRTIASGIHKMRPFRSAVLVVRVTAAMIALHGVEVLLWAGAFRWLCFSTWESAVYFSASSYATVGYGDVVLPSRWHMLGPLESVVGVLMCGLSVSFLFAIATRLVSRWR